MTRRSIFVKMLNNTCMQYSNARLLISDVRSSQRSEPQQFCVIAHPTSDQLKASFDLLSCAPRRTGSSLVFTILLQAAARRNNCSSFQIQFSISHFHPQALFHSFDWKSSHRYIHEQKCGRILQDQEPLPAFRLNAKANSVEGIVLLSRKKLESQSLAEVQFVIDSCRVVKQSNYLNNSNKDYDWLILESFIREQCTADATFTPLENKVWFENSANAW